MTDGPDAWRRERLAWTITFYLILHNHSLASSLFT